MSLSLCESRLNGSAPAAPGQAERACRRRGAAPNATRGAMRAPNRLRGQHRLAVVLDLGERRVEVVQQCPPLLVLRRAAEALGVVLQALPLHPEEEARAASLVQAAPQFQ